MGLGVVKSLVFGIIIGVICCYRGYTASGGARGVGITVRKTAVETMVCIIIADYALSNVFLLIWDYFTLGQI